MTTVSKRDVTDSERELLRRISFEIKKWAKGPGTAQTYSRLCRTSKVSYPAIRRLRLWSSQRDSPHLDTVIRILDGIGKRLEIVSK